MSNKEILISKFEGLPEEAKQQLLRYLDMLSKNYESSEVPKLPTYDWEGGLKDLNMTSVELQHKINDWR
jgi:hypothetical protein